MALLKSYVKKIAIPPDIKIKQKDYLKTGTIPVIDQGNRYISGYTDDADKTVDCKLPVIVFGDHTRVVKYTTKPFAAGADGIKVIEPVDGVDSKYLYYAIQYLISKMPNRGYARHYQYLEKMDLSIPELLYQQRIVARIEELFSQLDAGVETLKKTKQQLEVYRQAVLKEALCSGDEYRIGDCINDMEQGWSPKCERTQVINDDEWAVITTTAIQPMEFDYLANKRLPSDLVPREKHTIEVGDVLITRAGPRSRCGICCVVRKTKKRLLNCDKVYRIRVNENLILPEYLEAVLNSPTFTREISFCKTGGNDSGVNLTQNRFLNIKIPIPSISKQQNILSEIESQLSVCDSIERTVDLSMQQAESIRQCVLKQAFEGGL